MRLEKLGEIDGWTDIWKFTPVLQDIGPLGPLLKNNCSIITVLSEIPGENS